MKSHPYEKFAEKYLVHIYQEAKIDYKRILKERSDFPPFEEYIGLFTFQYLFNDFPLDYWDIASKVCEGNPLALWDRWNVLLRMKMDGL